MTVSVRTHASPCLAVRIVQAWVNWYTRGLPIDTRDERRDELQSDLWEEAHASNGESPGAAILARCLLGMPADLSWRLEQARTPGAVVALIGRGLAGLEAAGHWVTRRGLPGLTTLLAWMYLLGAVLLVVTLPLNQSRSPGGIIALATWAAFSGLLIRTGARAIPRHPWRGFLALAVGGLPSALALFATVVIPAATVIVLLHALGAVRIARKELRVPRLH